MSTKLLLALLVFAFGISACSSPSNNQQSANGPSPGGSPSPAKESISQLTLPALDALLHDSSFVRELQSQLQLSGEQIDSLKRVASAEVTRLREANAEEADGDAAAARDRASREIVATVGEDKANRLASFATEYWARGAGSEGGNGLAAVEVSLKPNAVPTDTRIVVNIPAFRMDVFDDGNLVKSYKVGIGYPQFPLPQGLRKAQTIIINPTWTPPDEPWVARMKNVSPGQTIEPGSKLNPLGPVKIPIGLPSLIHGGKAPAKIGTFASHGCVGLTTPQVKDLAKLLAHITDTDLDESTLEKYFRNRNTTKTVKLGNPVPVELRYETIVVEDGKVHIYKDVYKHEKNTEENLRTVLDAHGLRFDDLDLEQKNQLLNALNEMSAKPKPMPSPSPTATASENGNANRRENTRTRRNTKRQPRNEVVVEITALAGRGYPAPVNLDTGTGKPAEVAVMR